MVSLFMILIILMQKAKTDGGMGAAMGGGAAESAFGAETNTVLRKGTIYCSVIFFIMSFGIYLAHQHQRYQADRPARGIEEITPPEEQEEAGEAEVPLDPTDPVTGSPGELIEDMDVPDEAPDEPGAEDTGPDDPEAEEDRG